MGIFSSILSGVGSLFGGSAGQVGRSAGQDVIENMIVDDASKSLANNSMSWLTNGLGTAANTALQGLTAGNNFGLGPANLDPITVTANPGSVSNRLTDLSPQDWLKILPAVGGIAQNVSGLTQAPQPTFGEQPAAPQQQQPQQQQQQQPQQQQQGQPQTQAQPQASGGNPLTNILNGGSGLGLSGLIGALPALAQFFQKDDPYAAESQLGAMAKDIHGRYQSTMDTATANQQGMINGQATNAIERRLHQQEASIRQTYKQMGMSGSTMETQDLNNARMQAQDEVFKTGQEMATSGLATAAQLAGLESQDYQAMLYAEMERDKAFQEALSKIAAAAVTPGQSTQVNVGGQSSGGGGSTIGGNLGDLTSLYSGIGSVPAQGSAGSLQDAINWATGVSGGTSTGAGLDDAINWALGISG